MKTMRLTSFPLTVLTILLAFLVSSCDQAQTHSYSECIPPRVNLAFPVGATMVAGTNEQGILPRGDWETVTEIPRSQSSVVTSLVARAPHELWLKTVYDVFRYRTDKGEWTSFTLVDGLEMGTGGGLCAALDGTIWGVGIPIDALGLNAPLWSRYNDSSGQFEFVRDEDGLFSGIIAPTFSPPHCDEDKNGVFWMSAQDRDEQNRSVIVSFNSTSLQAVRQLPAPQDSYWGDIAIAPDGAVWIADWGAGQLVRYDPTTGQATPYVGNFWTRQDFSQEAFEGSIGNLYFDRSGRLWIQDRGWLDFTTRGQPMWYQVVRSPVFIDDQVHPESQYGWYRPSTTYQSSNGFFWFGYPAGMVRLDPESGEWCRFTTASGPIAEDEDHNLWIAVFNKLYKYSLEP